VVVSVMDGFDVCIFAYWQTGTGRDAHDGGGRDPAGCVNFRTLEKLFRIKAERKEQSSYRIQPPPSKPCGSLANRPLCASLVPHTDTAPGRRSLQCPGSLSVWVCMLPAGVCGVCQSHAN